MTLPGLPLHQLVWTRRPNRHYNNPAAFPTGTVTDLELARALVAHGADVNAPQTAEPQDGYRNMLNRTGATPFLLAAKAVDLEMMRQLDAVDGEEGDRTRTPLRTSMSRGLSGSIRESTWTRTSQVLSTPTTIRSGSSPEDDVPGSVSICRVMRIGRGIIPSCQR